MASPVGWADVATKRDIEVLEARLDSRINALEARLFRWMVPTLLTGMAIAAGIGRL